MTKNNTRVSEEDLKEIHEVIEKHKKSNVHIPDHLECSADNALTKVLAAKTYREENRSDGSDTNLRVLVEKQQQAIDALHDYILALHVVVVYQVLPNLCGHKD